MNVVQCYAPVQRRGEGVVDGEDAGGLDLLGLGGLDQDTLALEKVQRRGKLKNCSKIWEATLHFVAVAKVQKLLPN